MKHFCTLILTIASVAVLALDGKYFPGVPNDEKKVEINPILEAGAWKERTGLKIVAQERGLIFNNSSINTTPNDLQSELAVPVKKGKMLKVTTKFSVQESMPGSTFSMFVRLFSSEGKQLEYKRVASGRDTPPEHIAWCEEYIAIPNNSVSAKASVQFYGNPMTVKILEMKMETVDAKDKRPYSEPATIFHGKVYSDAEIDSALEKRAKHTYSIKTDGDQVEFLVDGAPEVLKLYKNVSATYNNSIREFAQKTPEMMKAGFNMFTVSVYLGVPGHFRMANTVWLGKKQYQIDVLKKLFRRTLQYSPDARIMLEFYVTPHPGWAEANPDEIAAHWDGRKMVMSGVRVHQLSAEPPKNYEADPKEPWTCPYWIPSYYSEKFSKDASEAIADILSEFEKTPESKALAGVFLSRGTDGQWFCLFPEQVKGVHSLADYSPVSLNQFRNYLRKKYSNNVAELRKAWNDPSASFDTAEIPRTEEFFISDKKVVRKTGSDRMGDFIESRGKGMADQYISLCKAIKRATGNRVLAGGYSAEGAITSWPFITQQCGKYMHDAPEIDFLASCPGGRRPENPVMPFIANGSMRLHGKLGFTELDFRSPTVWNWGVWGESIWYKTHDIKEFGERSMRAKLWSSAFGANSYAYDMDGNWYDAPSIIAAWKRNNMIQDLRKPAPLKNDRAAIFYSEAYWKHMALNANRAFAHIVKNFPREAFTRSGIDSDLYLLDDVLHPNLDAPKILCFADAVELTPEKASLIREKYGNSNRVIIWLWAPGIGVTEDIGKIAGFNLKRAPEADGKPVAALNGSSDPLLKGVKNLLVPSWAMYGMGPVWRVDDADAVVIGNYAGTDIPGAAVKRYASHTEVFIGQAGNLSPEFIRNIAVEAGAHIWTESNDPAAQAGNLILVSASSSGKKTVNLKPGMQVKRVVTGQLYEVANGKLTCEMSYGDVLVIELEEKECPM